MVSPPNSRSTIDSTRIKFCDKHKYLDERFFCSGLKKFYSISPVPLWDYSLKGNVIFSVPIAIIATELLDNLDELDSFFMTLESLIQQPGIDPNNVFVFLEKLAPVVAEIVQMYKFHLIVLDSDALWPFNDTCVLGSKMAEQAIKMVGQKERYVIVLHVNGLILSPDFLSFMAQLVPILDVDKSIIGISAWNPNGYSSVSNDVRLIYRVQQWPGVAFLTRSDECTDTCKIDMDYYCAPRAPVTKKIHTDHHILFPDVSRVLWRPYLEEIRNVSRNLKRSFITMPRNTNTISHVVLYNTSVLMNSTYYEHIQNLVEKSVVIRFSVEEIETCLLNNSFSSRLIKKFETRLLTIYYEEIDEIRQKSLKNLAECFGMYTVESIGLGGTYYGVFRFTLRRGKIFLINQNSPFGREIIPAGTLT